ncbi:hypothetical protein [Agromyces bauzanensis]
MPTAFDVRALTSTVRIELDDTLSHEERESIRSKWTDLLVDASDDPALTIRGSVADALAESKTRGSKSISLRSAAELAERITSEVTLSGISGLQGEALMLHAAAIALDDGGVIGFIGPSGRGKTTVSRALGRAYGYVTDEALAIRPDRSVVAYPKPLSIGERSSTKRAEPASGLGLRSTPRESLRLAALVLLDRRPGIEQPYVEQVALIDALPDLVPQTSYLSALDRPLRTLAELIASTGGVRRLVYSEAETLPPLVDDILSSVQEDQPPVTDVAAAYRRDCDCFVQMLPAGPSLTESPDSVKVRPGSYQRSNQTDALMIGDTLIVLLRHDVFVLDGIGPIVWLAADLLLEEELRDVVLQQLPAPPPGVDPAAAVSAAIADLMRAGLLLRRN